MTTSTETAESKALQRVYDMRFAAVYPLDVDIRYLDKLIEELAKGKAMEKILRGGQP